MRRFILQENVRRLRALAASATSEERRVNLAGLLAEAEAELATGAEIWRRTCPIFIPQATGYFLEDRLGELVDTQHAAYGSLHLHDRARNSLYLVAQVNFPPAFVTDFGASKMDGQPLWCRVASGSDQIWISDTGQHSNEYPDAAEFGEELGLRAMMGAPIISARQGMLGVCATYFLQVHHPTATDDTALDHALERLRPLMERLLHP